MLVQWKDGGEHSIVQTKLAVGNVSFSVGEEVSCQLDKANYAATILAVGEAVYKIKCEYPQSDTLDPVGRKL